MVVVASLGVFNKKRRSWYSDPRSFVPGGERMGARSVRRVLVKLVDIQEHQAGDLVFVKYNYLYILLRATSARVIVQWLKYRDPSTVATRNRFVWNPMENQQTWTR